MRQKHWHFYQQQVLGKERRSLLELAAAENGFEGRGLFGGSSPSNQRVAVQMLLARLAQAGITTEGLDRVMEDATSEQQDERKLFELGMEFLRASETGDVETVRKYVEAGYPVNFQDPRNRLTALHNACALTLREVARVLINSSRCNYLLRDASGRTAFELANRLGHDIAVEKLVYKKSIQQAKRDGIDFWETCWPKAK